MSKGKYKRKRERTRQKAKQEVNEVRFPHSEVIPAKKQPESSKESNAKRSEEKETPMRLSEAVKRSSFTDWCIAAFTLALTVVAIYQLAITGSQLDTMRKDQRPWIKVSFTSHQTQALAPVGGTVHLVNNGKTPARGVVHGDFVVETVKNGEQPRLDYPLPYIRFTTGMITPNDTPADIFVERERSGAKNAPEIDPLMASEFEEFKQVKIFFVVYGTVHYADFFGTDHWTKFCSVILPPNPPPDSTMSGQACTNYGDVDSN